MNDFHDLTDAFDELERRADTAPVRSGLPTDPRASHRGHPVLVAASTAGVLAIATTVAITASGNSSEPDRDQAGGPGSSSRSSAPVIQTTSASTPAASTAIPDTAKDLERLFTTVLDGVATVTVTDTGAAGVQTAPTSSAAPSHTLAPNASGSPAAPRPDETTGAQTSGAAIVGLLTSRGVSGGYDIQIFQDSPGTKAQCDDPGQSSCSVHALANGSWLATGSEPLEDGGVTYQAELVQPDGTTVLMHVSNDRDPKGAGGHTAARPPLTIDQMSTIVTSDRW